VTWRVGTKLGRTLYRDEVFVGTVDTPEIAAEIVAAMNAKAEPTCPCGWCVKRAEAEQRVLDACSGAIITPDVIERSVRLSAVSSNKVAVAELARRGLKP
jgi:hypothetical protein